MTCILSFKQFDSHIPHMNICKWFLLPIFILPLIAEVCVAQPEIGRSRYLKNVSEARNRALTGTMIPLITGVAATKLFKSETMQTVGASLAVYGLVMGPSTGNYYAEDYMRGTLGAVVRAGVGYYLLLDATRELMGKQVSESLGWDDKDVELTDTRVLIGAGVFLGSMIYNVISSKQSVDEYNGSMGYGMRLDGENVGGKTVPVVTARFAF